MKTISLVLPAYNEEKNIPLLFDAIHEQFDGTPYSYEILFVNDASSDRTLDVIKYLAKRHPEVRYISFSRNFGKEAAILAGLQHAAGDATILMDTDLQHPPSLIPDMVAGFEQGFDQVIAKRDRAGESRTRKLASRTYYKLINKIVDVELEDGVGDFRLLSREAVDALLRMNEHQRFSKGLFSWIGMEQKTITYQNVLRQNGETKWSFSQLFNYGVDGLISFNSKPLRFCFYSGVLILLLSMLYILLTLFDIIQDGIDTPGYFTLISAILLLGGIQLVSLGIIGEYVGRIYFETKRRPAYLIQETNIQRKSANEQEKGRVYKIRRHWGN
ncbi:glycosyltransferase [Exiguobacterium sp. SH31]|uniref:glycosyltransferase family 2 protein n=1 Tax=Exiguobacterium TaxID=33986 RepID=UPI00087776DA|nr:MULTISPECIES: glycosyltransferase family 2 protein [Exiguobacterium]OGX79292.1 glycosyltransferase [Exiguobacterium sp. SH31]TCI70363.1 glycosyltransferase [Exiguobacterium sp. SH0S7]